MEMVFQTILLCIYVQIPYRRRQYADSHDRQICFIIEIVRQILADHTRIARMKRNRLIANT